MEKHRKSIIWVEFRKLEGDRIYVSSPDLPGLQIVGDDLALLRRDIPIVIKDMLFHGFNLVADVEFLPPLEDTLRFFSRGQDLSTKSRDVFTEAVLAEIREAT